MIKAYMKAIVVLQRIVISILILSSIYQSVLYLLSTNKLGSLENDPVTIWNAKFAKIKKALPAETKTVGYLADWDIPDSDYYNADLYNEYVLTQYALAPIIVVRGSNYEWVIGNLTPEGYQIWRKTTQEKYDVVFSKYGLYLFHRIEP